ncbi:hypothetical protein [Nesterenkonia muleiensis]|uniref:hypothetical protein n=1 Tax=Nesterenkonia muleiensis TaxID=2282648 RepID=UPI001390167C|nr:hypothetical protein [Nesterenkonia muleiensis]
MGTTLGSAMAAAVAVGYAAQAAVAPSAAMLTEGFGVAFIVVAGVAAIGAVLALTLLGPGSAARAAEESRHHSP